MLLLKKLIIFLIFVHLSKTTYNKKIEGVSFNKVNRCVLNKVTTHYLLEDD